MSRLILLLTATLPAGKANFKRPDFQNQVKHHITQQYVALGGIFLPLWSLKRWCEYPLAQTQCDSPTALWEDSISLMEGAYLLNIPCATMQCIIFTRWGLRTFLLLTVLPFRIFFSIHLQWWNFDGFQIDFFFFNCAFFWSEYWTSMIGSLCKNARKWVVDQAGNLL